MSQNHSLLYRGFCTVSCSEASRRFRPGDQIFWHKQFLSVLPTLAARERFSVTVQFYATSTLINFVNRLITGQTSAM